jgi:uncharacterized damage-inducible protein DinB
MPKAEETETQTMKKSKAGTTSKTELDLLREWYKYNSEVRKKYFQAISHLPEEEQRKDRGASFPSILDIFTHVLDAYRWWFLYVYRDKAQERVRLRGTDLSLEEIEQEEHKIDTRVKKFLQKLSIKDLAKNIVWHEEFKDKKGTKKYELTITMRDMLWQLVGEELQHRGELNALLWQIDIDPPITEWVDWNEKAQVKLLSSPKK